jgi:hypothetical protein
MICVTPDRTPLLWLTPPQLDMMCIEEKICFPHVVFIEEGICADNSKVLWKSIVSMYILCREEALRWSRVSESIYLRMNTRKAWMLSTASSALMRVSSERMYVPIGVVHVATRSLALQGAS